MNGSSSVDAAADARRMHLEARARRSAISTRIASVARNDSGIASRRFALVVERALEVLHRVRLVRVRLERQRRSARATRCAPSASGCACTPSPTSRSAPSRTAPRSRRTPAACACRPLNFAALAAMPATDAEHLRVELARVRLPADRDRRARSPCVAVTRRSSSRTFAWSPSNSSRKLACVPVVPFTPRKGSVAMRCSRSARSSTRSCIHSVARLPTVVELRGLQVRVAERRLVAPLAREARERARASRSPSSRSSARPRRIRIRSRVVGDVSSSSRRDG